MSLWSRSASREAPPESVESIRLRLLEERMQMLEDALMRLEAMMYARLAVLERRKDGAA